MSPPPRNKAQVAELARLVATGAHRPAWSIDQKFARISQRIPGFGGLFFDEHGDLQVGVTDDAVKAASITPAILAEFGPDFLSRGRPAGDVANVEVVVVDYGVHELFEQYDSALPHLMAHDNVVSTDVDEVRNRLVVGVDQGSIATVWELLDELGANRDMFVVQEEARPRLARGAAPLPPLLAGPNTLQGQFDTLMGGIRIDDVDGDSGDYCTLGFPVLFNNGLSFEAPGFITNSHCTEKPDFTMQSTDVGQPDVDRVVGTEVRDPGVFFGGECSDPNDGCRYSDAAIIEADVPLYQGNIARPDTVGSITIVDGSGNRITPMSIAGEVLSVAVGETVSKVGQRTGMSHGNVTNSCKSLEVRLVKQTLLCQIVVSANSAGGDSGSPVVSGVVSADGTISQEVMLVGILWGTDGGSYFASPISGVHSDLGWFTATVQPM